MGYIKQLAIIQQNAINDLMSKIEKDGVESDHINDKVLKITDENLMFNIEGGRYLVEVAPEYLIDNCGYHYSHCTLENEQFMQVVDHLLNNE